MSPRIRWLSRYGNGVLAVLFALSFLSAVIDGRFALALLCLAAGVFAVFNVYAAQMAAAATAEEEWLTAEIRKAELRRRLVTFRDDTPEAVVRQHGL